MDATPECDPAAHGASIHGDRMDRRQGFEPFLEFGARHGYDLFANDSMTRLLISEIVSPFGATPAKISPAVAHAFGMCCVNNGMSY